MSDAPAPVIIWYLRKKGPMGGAPYMGPRLGVVSGISPFTRERKGLVPSLYYSYASGML